MMIHTMTMTGKINKRMIITIVKSRGGHEGTPLLITQVRITPSWTVHKTWSKLATYSQQAAGNKAILLIILYLSWCVNFKLKHRTPEQPHHGFDKKHLLETPRRVLILLMMSASFSST